MRQSELYLEKADRALLAAERLLEHEDWDFAASRIYYAYFYTAQALLLTQGLRFTRHGQVIAQFGRYFAKTKLIDPRFHNLLDMAFELRQVADYQIEIPMDPDVVMDLLREGRRFIEAAATYLKQLPEPKEESDA